MPLPASAPLVFAHPSRCVRTFTGGMVKRMLAAPKSHLIAWQVRCPSCGFVGSYLPEEGPDGRLFTEGPWVHDTGEPRPGAPAAPFQHPETLEMAKAVVCFGCRGMLRITGGQVVVTPAGGT